MTSTIGHPGPLAECDRDPVLGAGVTASSSSSSSRSAVRGFRTERSISTGNDTIRHRHILRHRCCWWLGNDRHARCKHRGSRKADLRDL